MKGKKRKLLKSVVIIEIFLIFCCIIMLFSRVNQLKRAEQVRAQIQIQQEERRKQEEQERLEKQKEQEGLARQEREKYEEMKNSLPAKFNMRDKIKITAEDQRQKPFCSVYAQFKSMEIALNYQGNYNYDFKEVYKYLKTASDELPEEIGNGKLYDLSKELLGFDFTYNTYSHDSEDFLILVKNEIVNGRPMLIDINAKLSETISGAPKRNCKRT